MALQYPRSDIRLAFCRKCGFIFNAAFDPFVHEYSSAYEATQAFSPAFNAFHQKLAANLIERYSLHNKTIIEIGCGNGDFLTMLCNLGDNRGIGFDPSFQASRHDKKNEDRITFIKDFYPPKQHEYEADFVCCKMTLEHIPDPARFLKNVRRAIGPRHDATIFFQVPEARRILQEAAFWDIYYEHCSYFSKESMRRLFQNCGFEVTDIWTDYDGQYLMAAGKARDLKDDFRSRRKSALYADRDADLNSMKSELDQFADEAQRAIASWNRQIGMMVDSGRKVVIWPSSSKTVSFLTTLEIRAGIEFAVDINPYRQGSFLAGTGQEIVGPEFLKDYRPDTIILLNPVYKSEIELMLKGLGLGPDIMTV